MARTRSREPHEQGERRCLASAIRPHQTANAPLLDLKRGAVDRRLVSVTLDELVSFDDDFIH